MLLYELIFMTNFTLFLTYQTTEQASPHFHRVLQRLQKLVHNFPGTVEILVFYCQALDIDALKKEFPSTRWWRINQAFADKNLLLARAMRVSRGKFFFCLDGTAFYALNDFTNMANILEWHGGMVYAQPKFYLNINTTANRFSFLKNKFVKKSCKEQNDIYQCLYTQAHPENFRLCAFDKKSMGSFFTSLSKEQRFSLLRQNMYKAKTKSFKDRKFLVPFVFFSLLEKTNNKNLLLQMEESATRFFCFPVSYFSFYKNFLELFQFIFTYKHVPSFVSANWFSVPVIQLAFLFFVIFFFSASMRWISLTLIFLFAILFAVDKTAKISPKKIVLFPFRLLKKIFFILWL